MNDLVPIFIVWIVFYYTYKLIELFARQKERILMIEKRSTSGENIELPDRNTLKRNYTPLRFGCMLIGIGVGMLFGVLLNTILANSGYKMTEWPERKLFEMSLGASVLLFGGLGLLISYPLERKFFREEKT